MPDRSGSDVRMGSTMDGESDLSKSVWWGTGHHWRPTSLRRQLPATISKKPVPAKGMNIENV